MTNTFRKISRYAAAPVLACGLTLLLAGCDQSFSVSGSDSAKTGPSVTATWEIKTHQPLQKFASWMPTLSGNDLASFDPSQALITFSLSNATITSTNGTANVTVADSATGQVLGQQAIGYVIRGNSAFAEDPAGVSAWLQQFTTYPNVDVTVDISTDLQATNAGNASAAANAQYSGITYGSSTVSWSRPVGGGGGCHTRICPNQ